jgi:NAD+ kinase
MAGRHIDHNSPVAISEDAPAAARALRQRLGVVVHPTRTIDPPLEALRRWTDAHGIEVVQVAAPCPQQQVAERGDPAQCDLIVSIGGDGTALAALRTGAAARTPVLGVAYGSLGALASVDPDALGGAVERFSRGDWTPRRLPALVLGGEGGDEVFALNDVAIVRAGEGQVRVAAYVDGVLFARFAGDGCIASTPRGSTGYSLSAGGPLLPSQLHAFVLTTLPSHGGFHPPLILHGDSELRLRTVAGYGGSRLELDGQIEEVAGDSFSITMRPDAATLVGFDDQEPLLGMLRRRRIIVDSPRTEADDALR